MSSKTTSGGMSLCSALTLLFVGLKLCDKINWSWWWVLAPLWIPFALAFVLMGILGLIIVIEKIIRRVAK